MNESSVYAAIRVLVLLLVLLPLLWAVFVQLFGRAARRASLLLAILHLGITAAVIVPTVYVLHDRAEGGKGIRAGDWIRFRPEFVPGSQLGTPTDTSWNLLTLSSNSTPGQPGPSIQFFIGVDGLNIWLVALASLMMIPAILVSLESIEEKPASFYGLLFLLQGGAIGAFLSFDVILFYIFFELTLIPTFFLIGRWGMGSGRRDAARKFFLYTLAGSLLTLLGVISIVLAHPDPRTGQITFSLPELMANVQTKLHAADVEARAGYPTTLHSLQNTQFWVFLALMAGFMVKVPVWPFHTWLPSAYGESPPGVTILLAALLAKLGTFGILRFVLPLTPDAAILYGLPLVGSLAAFGIVYAAFCAYDQKDIKLVIAYSSVSHLGFLVLGLFAFNEEGLSGAMLHTVNHGLSTGHSSRLMAFLVDRCRTTQVSQFGGLMRFPNFAVLTFVLCLASIGLPGLNNFVSEMLMLAGLFDTGNPRIHHLGLAVVAAIGILLSAWYMLTTLQRVFFNPMKEPQPVIAQVTDVTRREFFAFGTLAVLCLILGLFPQPILDSMRWDIKQLDRIGVEARSRIAGVPAPPELDVPTVPALPDVQQPGGPKGGGPKGGGPKGGGFQKGGAKGNAKIGRRAEMAAGFFDRIR